MADPESIGAVVSKLSPTIAQAKVSLPRPTQQEVEAAQQERYRAQERETLLRAAGVGDRHLNKKPDELRRHKEWAAMVDRAWNLIEKGAPILAFLGNRGNGKTQAATMLIRHATYNLKPARYLQCRQVGSQIRATYRADSDVTEDGAMRHLVEPWLLVLDECQGRFDTPHELETLTMLLDMRYGACRPTVLIANCSDEAFKDLMGPAVIDRMKEGGGRLEFTWQSFRA